jgi:hypothetical protein
MAATKVQRAVFDEVINKLLPNKVLILYGARRVGKTELVRTYLKTQPKDSYLLLNGEDQTTIDLLETRSVANYKRLLGDRKLLAIDEAQHIPDIGMKLKLMVDEIENLRIVVTGSSVFDLSNTLGEPLVGRSNVIQLHPLAQMEYSITENLLETKDNLEDRLLFGGYPELAHIPNRNDKINYLEGIVNSYLLKDILAYEGIKKSDKILDLLRLLAFQVGKEVSVDELSKGLKGISRNTVESYLDLLSKVFIIYKVGGYSGNLRKEVTKSNRWYFVDNGIRNAIVRNFNPLNLRMDTGDLWENYLMAERIKFNSYTNRRVNSYFWRTYDQQEIDLVEEAGDNLSAFEFKWNSTRKVKVPGAWKKNYASASFEVISQENYLDFIGG